ncbi:MAG: hypothetical protein LUE22_01410 [Oscillospiraceae bacterium]|nr:hypothetical protein [Oscillospiraceae bacterium]
MVRLIMGLKGTGKTKLLVDLVRKAVDEEHGDVICIEKDKNLTYDIPYQARLVHASQYGISSIDLMGGFISGLAAGNFDITHVFIDNLFKIIGEVPESTLAKFLAWLERFGETESITFTVTASADAANFGEGVTKYLYQA